METELKVTEIKLRLILVAAAVTFLSSFLPTALNYFAGLPTGLQFLTGKRPLDFSWCFAFISPYLYLWIFIQLKIRGKISFIHPAVNPICWLGIVFSPIAGIFQDGTIFLLNYMLQWLILISTILFLISRIIWKHLAGSGRSAG